MKIVNAGDVNYSEKGEFHFKCARCGCEWYANREDPELHISPPCVEFFTYMACPNCGKTTHDREIYYD